MFKFLSALWLSPSAAPASPANGAVYYDSTAKRIKSHDGSAWQQYLSAADMPGGIVYASGTPTTVVNTTTETALASFTVPAGTLGANGALRVRLLGRLLNNSGSDSAPILNITYGGTSIYKCALGAIASSASNHAVDIDIVLGGANATNSQVLAGRVNISSPTAPTTGYGSLSVLATNTTGANSSVYGTCAVDSTTNQTLTITVKHAAANASLSMTAAYVAAVNEGAIGPAGPAGAAGAAGATGAAGTSLNGINAQTGTTYTLVGTDTAKLVTCSNASAITVTVPPNASVAHNVGDPVYVAQTGASQVTLAPGSGVTLNNPAGLKSRAQYSTLALVYQGSDVWLVMGDATT